MQFWMRTALKNNITAMNKIRILHKNVGKEERKAPEGHLLGGARHHVQLGVCPGSL
jgi:hypothetical protein